MRHLGRLLLTGTLLVGCGVLDADCRALDEVEARANDGRARARLQIANVLADGRCGAGPKSDALMWLVLIKTQPLSMGEFGEDGGYLGDSSRAVMEFGLEVATLEQRLRGELSPEEIEAAEQRAATWVTPKAEVLRATAQSGDAQAQFELAMLHLDATSNLPYAEAVPWLERAAAQGHADAAFRLGEHYRWHTRPPDLERAVANYRIAADAGHYMGRNNLMVAYWRGEGVEQDLLETYRWLLIHKARDAGFPANMEDSWRTGVHDRLTEAERAQAASAAETWLREHPEADIR